MMFGDSMMMSGALSTYNIANAMQANGVDGVITLTPGVAGDRQKFTVSTWPQRGKSGIVHGILATAPGGANWFESRFHSDDKIWIYFENASDGSIKTTQVFRDPSSPLHIVLAVDTTQAIAADRVKLYVNGVRVTAFDVATYPSLNLATSVNNSVAHRFADSGNNDYLYGLAAETHIVSGAQLEASDFGEFDLATGNWKAKKFNGAYGSNGAACYLNFSKAGVGSLGNDLGYDASGNGNHWTATGGLTQVTSTPPNVYAAGNPQQTKASCALSNGNTTFTNTGGITGGSAGTFSFDIATAAIEWEVTIVNNPYSELGIVQVVDETITTSIPATRHIYYGNNGQTYIGASNTVYGATFTTGDKIKVRVDNGTVNFYKWDGVSAWVDQGVAWSGLTGEWLPFFSFGGTGVYTVDFGQAGFIPDTGYSTFCTDNMPSRSPATPASPQTGNVVCNGTTDNAMITLNMVPDKAGTSTVDGVTLVWGTNALACATGVKLISAVFTGTLAYSIAVQAYTGGSNVAPANGQVNP